LEKSIGSDLNERELLHIGIGSAFQRASGAISAGYMWDLVFRMVERHICILGSNILNTQYLPSNYLLMRRTSRRAMRNVRISGLPKYEGLRKHSYASGIRGALPRKQVLECIGMPPPFLGGWFFLSLLAPFSFAIQNPDK
jgi:hypothetical protein